MALGAVTLQQLHRSPKVPNQSFSHGLSGAERRELWIGSCKEAYPGRLSGVYLEGPHADMSCLLRVDLLCQRA